MDTKGANTFPLYNLPPELKIFQKRSFSVLLCLSLLDKIKVGGDSSLPQHVLRQKLKSQFSHRITELATLLGRIKKEGLP